MTPKLLLALLALLALGAGTVAASADQAKIDNAVSAAPSSLSRNAAVMQWDGTMLREGTNGWTCLPDRTDTEGNDPWCVDQSWLNLIKALMGGAEPSYDKVGIAYMLMGDTPISNIEPMASKEDSGEHWVEGLGAHLMLLVPDRAAFENVSTDPNNGGPWIMWPDTPYAHIMVPIDAYPE